MRNAAFRPIARSLLLSAGMVGAVSSAHAVQAAGEADLGGLSLE
jgi:hypothetical protein